MINTAELGITIQKVICDLYHVEIPVEAIGQFEANYNDELRPYLKPVIQSIFKEIGQAPIQCLTYTYSNKIKETLSPHNFILSDESTFSVRSNKKGDKVAPRVVGQAGLSVFNDHFEDIIGYPVENKQEIKKAVYDNIHLMMPIFLDYILISDYTAWIQADPDNAHSFRYTIFDKSQTVDMLFERDNFTFTRDLHNWNESTTLKYKNNSIAEIQIHKNRTFKFRFIMSALAQLLVNERITNETFGITAEKTICDVFKLKVPDSYAGRYSVKMERELKPIVIESFTYLPNPIENTGALPGERGKNSKCSYDFLLEGNKTLSLKTNTGNMVCPPEVGQPGASTCYMYFSEFVDEDHMDEMIFKKMVLEHIKEIFPIYVSHMFDSDYLLWLFKKKDTYHYKIFNYDYANNIEWEEDLFSFTKPTIEEWNESNTLKYDGISIGEFQVHKLRDSYKFRFNLDNFSTVVERKEKNDAKK
ncbi:MAG: hypothetical protein E7187_02310 [Erysipelotrichaceae bacterium]|nr:hypothetical protein [Erysipelotrichaceae bacterium]